jgi:hypothetical protein
MHAYYHTGHRFVEHVGGGRTNDGGMREVITGQDSGLHFQLSSTGGTQDQHLPRQLNLSHHHHHHRSASNIESAVASSFMTSLVNVTSSGDIIRPPTCPPSRSSCYSTELDCAEQGTIHEGKIMRLEAESNWNVWKYGDLSYSIVPLLILVSLLFTDCLLWLFSNDETISVSACAFIFLCFITPLLATS